MALAQQTTHEHDANRGVNDFQAVPAGLNQVVRTPRSSVGYLANLAAPSVLGLMSLRIMRSKRATSA